jgi:hypothetical protein
MPHLSADHADHDRLAIAVHAAGDATGTELDRALALVAACPDCAALHHDLRAIAAALPAIPAPQRTRDFRLTPGQAATLRPAGWRRVLAPFAGPRFAFAGPLGTGLATLGVAGLLVAGLAGTPLLPAGGVATDQAAGQGAGAERGLGSASLPKASAGDLAASSSPPSAAASAAPGNGTDPGPSVVAQFGVASVPSASSVPMTVNSGSGGHESPGPETNIGAGALGSPVASPGSDVERLQGTPPVPDAGDNLAAAQPGVAGPFAIGAMGVVAAFALVVGVLLGGVRLVARRVTDR